MSSSVHTDNKRKDILILGKGPTQGLDDTTLITWKKTWLNWYVYKFSVDYRTFDTTNIIDIHTYLMEKHDIK